ncbi:MAG: PIG-L family deacetylase [Acetobacteraceae bacterium]|nr:PIG-L family deacetylase [Acetobacteraceae bacterium]
MNPYREWVEAFAAALPRGSLIAPAPPEPSAHRTGGPNVLLFAPHPDDEAIIGGLPLRMQREAGATVTVVAVTLGSRVDRRAARWREQEAACAALGFRLITPNQAGLERITPAGRADEPNRWAAAVEATASIIAEQDAAFVFLPHAADWNQTHIGTHLLVRDALGCLPDLAVHTVETEFWGAMAAPNLMVESSAADVADLVLALALHTGEVARNPYHLRLPAWMMDNVRRGAELVGGQGSAAPPFTFATLYRLRRWCDGGFQNVQADGRTIGADALATVI